MSIFDDNIKFMRAKELCQIERVKAKLTVLFEMVDTDSISFYLRLKVERYWQKQSFKLSQPVYIKRILWKYHLYLAKLCNIPIKEGILLPNERPEASQVEREQYQGMTGWLIFPMVETRPDIPFAILVVIRFAKNLLRQHTKVMKTIL